MTTRSEPGRYCFVDVASSTAPFSYYFLSQLSHDNVIDVYCSDTRYNGLFVEALSENPRIALKRFKISSSLQVHRLRRILELWKLYLELLSSRRKYKKIFLNFPPSLILDLILWPIFNSRIHWLLHNVDRKSRLPDKFARWVRTILYNNIVFLSEAGLRQYSRASFPRSSEHKNFFVAEHGLLPLTLQETSLSANWRLSSRDDETAVIVIGNVKAYKGIYELNDLPQVFENTTVSCRLYGKFENAQLIPHFKKKGWLVDNDFQTEDALLRIITSESIFILPHLESTQSGLYYTLLNYRALFVCSRCGQQEIDFDKYGLRKLLFSPGNVREAVHAIKWLMKNRDHVALRMEELRASITWGSLRLTRLPQ